MPRILAGFAIAVGLFLLVGAGGDNNPLEGRVKKLEDQAAFYKGEQGRLSGQLRALEGRVSALEKKSGAAGSPGPAAAGDKPVAGGADEPAATPDGDAPVTPDDPLSVYVASKEQQKVIRALRTANYSEVSGLIGLWSSPIKTSMSGSRKAFFVGKVRYIGDRDLTDQELTVQIIYRNKAEKVVGELEFTVPCDLLKPDTDYEFRQSLELAEEYSATQTVELTVLRVAKKPLGTYGNTRRRP